MMLDDTSACSKTLNVFVMYSMLLDWVYGFNGEASFAQWGWSLQWISCGLGLTVRFPFLRLLGAIWVAKVKHWIIAHQLLRIESDTEYGGMNSNTANILVKLS